MSPMLIEQFDLSEPHLNCKSLHDAKPLSLLLYMFSLVLVRRQFMHVTMHTAKLTSWVTEDRTHRDSAGNWNKPE